jgi:hypothetical protein
MCLRERLNPLLSSARALCAWRYLRRTAACVWVAAAISTTALAGQRSDLDATLDSIRRAFRAEDAATLLRQFSAGRPVYISIPRFEKGRFFGPGPLHALLDRVIADTETVTFDFTSTGEPALTMRRNGDFASRSLRVPLEPPRATGQRQVYVKARWTFVETASELRRTLNVYLAIQRQSDDGDWRIVELKAFD